MAETAATTTTTTTTSTETPSSSSLSGMHPHQKSKVDFAEVQETVSRLAAHKGVTAVLILNKEGDILTQTGQGMVGNPKLLKQTLDAAALYIRSIPNDDDDDDDDDDQDDPQEETANGTSSSSSPSSNQPSAKDLLEKLSFVRIRSRREEILVAPKSHYVLVVLQDPSSIEPL